MSGAEVISFREFVYATDPDADVWYVEGVRGPEGGDWRWTYSEPQFRFSLRSTKNQIFRLDFGIHELTFRDTGPVTLSILINGLELHRPRFEKPGDLIYERKVPANMLTPNSETRVVIRVLNPWKAPVGPQLGFVLRGAGFVTK